MFILKTHLIIQHFSLRTVLIARGTVPLRGAEITQGSMLDSNDRLRVESEEMRSAQDSLVALSRKEKLVPPSAH